MAKHLNHRIEDDLYERIERARGMIPRTRWINHVLERHLDRKDASERLAAAQAGLDPTQTPDSR